MIATFFTFQHTEDVQKQSEDVTPAAEGDIMDTSSLDSDSDDDDGDVDNDDDDEDHDPSGNVILRKSSSKRPYAEILCEPHQEDVAKKKTKRSEDNESDYIPFYMDFHFDSPVYTSPSSSSAQAPTPTIIPTAPSFESPNIRDMLTDSFATQSTQILALQAHVHRLHSENINLKARVNTLEATVYDLTKQTSLIIPLQDRLDTLQAEIVASKDYQQRSQQDGSSFVYHNEC